jgi:hypothetical protein
LNLLYVQKLLALWVVLLVPSIGVRRSSVVATRGTSTSTLASSTPTTIRTTRLECVLFGLFNYLTI